MNSRFRKLEDGEIDTMYATAKEAVESLRLFDARNQDLTLGPMPQVNHGEEAIVCVMQGFRHCDNIGKWQRELNKAVPGSVIALEAQANGTMVARLTLPLHVPLPVTGQPLFYGTNRTANAAAAPSLDRLILYLVILIMIVGIYIARLPAAGVVGEEMSGAGGHQHARGTTGRHVGEYSRQ